MLAFFTFVTVESTWQQVDRTLAVSLAKKAERAAEARRVARKSAEVVDEEEDEQQKGRWERNKMTRKKDRCRVSNACSPSSIATLDVSLH